MIRRVTCYHGQFGAEIIWSGLPNTFDMAFASDADDRTAHALTDGNDQGTVFDFSFTLAKTRTATVRGLYAAPRAGAASHTDPGRERGPLAGAPLAPADR